MVKMDKKLRQSIETLIYQTMDTLDKTKTNSEHYKSLFAKYDDKEFINFCSLDLPFKLHVSIFEIEPSMEDASNACKLLGVPLLEKINLPYLYKNKDGVPVSTQECLVGYTHIKRMSQLITKKNAMSTDITSRDMKTGLLNSSDKNGMSSDREIEGMLIMNLDKTTQEFSGFRADAMNIKNKGYNNISVTGQVTLDDIVKDKDDSLAKNLLNTYLIGSHLISNLVGEDYLLPYTIKNRSKKVIRV